MHEIDEFKLPGDNANPDLGILSATMSGSAQGAALGETELQSRKIEDALVKDEVSNVNIDRLESIEDRSSCLIDFSNSKRPVVSSWLGALKNLIVSSEGDTIPDAWEKENIARKRRGQADIRADVAVYIKTKSGVILAGYGDSLQIYRVLRNMVHASFGDEVKVYSGKGDKALFKEWKSSDVSGVRLRL